MDNQHRKITGYRELTQAEIDAMNAVTEHEETLRGLLHEVDKIARQSGDAAAGRWAALARTALEEGCMWARKAIARPDGTLGRRLET